MRMHYHPHQGALTASFVIINSTRIFSPSSFLLPKVSMMSSPNVSRWKLLSFLHSAWNNFWKNSTSLVPNNINVSKPRLSTHPFMHASNRNSNDGLHSLNRIHIFLVCVKLLGSIVLPNRASPADINLQLSKTKLEQERENIKVFCCTG